MKGLTTETENWFDNTFAVVRFIFMACMACRIRNETAHISHSNWAVFPTTYISVMDDELNEY